MTESKSVDFDDLLAVCASKNNTNVSLVDFEVPCQKVADGLVCGAFYGGRLDFDFQASVGEVRYAFALASRVDLDVYAHFLAEHLVSGIERRDGTFVCHLDCV